METFLYSITASAEFALLFQIYIRPRAGSMIGNFRGENKFSPRVVPEILTLLTMIVIMHVGYSGAGQKLSVKRKLRAERRTFSV